MSLPPGTSDEIKIHFKWGNKKGVGGEKQLYDSFIFDDVEYFLFDWVYLYRTGDLETSIGKLVRIYETPSHEKKVRVIWMLRPSDIRNQLGDYRPDWNELFLPCGVAKGVSNFNSLYSIQGKCNVVCTAKDKRNREPSEAQLNMADYFFKNCFDMGRLSIVGEFGDLIGGVKVEEFFNRKKVKFSDQISRPTIVIKWGSESSGMPRQQFDGKDEVKPDNDMQKISLLNSSSHNKRKMPDHMQSSNQSKEPTKKEDLDRRRKLFYEGASELGLLREGAPEHGLKKAVKNCGEFMEITGRPGNEKRRWFLKSNWEEKLRKAQESGCLILLNNLDPSYTSYEVEDLIWHALEEVVEAKIVEWSPTFNQHFGRAFVVFKTKVAAADSLYKLNKACLILGDGRVVSAAKGRVREAGKQTSFPGHLVIELDKQTEGMKNALSTSHCAQTNTIESGMSYSWRKLQHLSDTWWDAIYKAQKDEMQNVMSRLTM